MTPLTPLKQRIFFFALLALITVTMGCARERAKPEREISERARAHYKQGVELYYQKKFDEAISEFKKAIRIEPGYAESYCELGVTYMEKEEFDIALKPLTKAIKLQPDFAKAHYALAVAYIRKKDPEVELAKVHYKKAVQHGYHVPKWFNEYLKRVEEGG